MADFQRLEMVSVVVAVEFLAVESGQLDTPMEARHNMQREVQALLS